MNPISKRSIAAACFSLAFLLWNCSDNRQGHDRFPVPLKFGTVQPSGILKDRIDRNFLRLHDSIYQPQYFYPKSADNDWPGDWEGRIILGLTLDEQATQEKAKYLDNIYSQLGDHLNAKGYLGPVHQDSISEQQLSGHGWLLRGLCELYAEKQDQRILNNIKLIVDSLALPTLGYHAGYPIDPARRNDKGGFSGSEGSVSGRWHLSTDIGCDFIFLDGLTQAYEYYPSESLKKLINEMIARFLETGLTQIRAQTHATLTALRAMSRWYTITGNEKLLHDIVHRFELYVSEGMTENYENYNWFGRPQWTEPCAVVDSYILSVDLWRYTGDTKYLELAHEIYYNGLNVEQRANGGFGLQTCSGARDSTLGVVADEAYWCCTMRGAEGLSRAVQYSMFTSGDTLYIPFFNSMIADVGSLRLREATEYPLQNDITIQVESHGEADEKHVKLFYPSWATGFTITLNDSPIPAQHDRGYISFSWSPKDNDVIKYHMDVSVVSHEPHNKHSIAGHHLFMFGPLVLGTKAPVEALPAGVLFKRTGNQFQGPNGSMLQPIMHDMDSSVKQHGGYHLQVMFRN